MQQCLFNLTEHSDNYLKTTGSLYQYFGDERAVNNNGAIVDFNEANSNKSFNSKAEMTGQMGNNGRKDVEIIVPLIVPYLRNIWRTLEMPLINCEINLILTWCCRWCRSGVFIVNFEHIHTLLYRFYC